MKYDFDTIVDRSNNKSSKYDELMKKFGTTDVIPLWVADMDIKIAQPIIDALKSRAEEGVFGYVSRPESYFKSACDWQKRRNNWDITPEYCSWSIGVVPALTSIARIWGKEKGNFLIQTPVYNEFFEVAHNSNMNVVENKLLEDNGNWSIDWVDFEEKLKDVDMFLLCNPQNPTGKVWDKDSLIKMVELCHKYDVFMISDEIHGDLIFHNKTFIPAGSVSELAKETVVTCFSGSKSFNMAGMQSATVVFPKKEMKTTFDSWWNSLGIHRNNAFSIVAMEVCYTNGEEWLEQLLEYLSGNFDYVVDYCEKNIPKIKTYAPDATYLMWLDCRELGLTNEELNKFMIEKAKIGLNSGTAFSPDLQGYMRLNAACSRKLLEKAMNQLKEAVDKL